MVTNRTKCLLVYFMLQMLTSISGNSQDFRRDSIIEDIRQLADILESSHPDPYIRGGGKIAFHRRLHQLILSIPEEGTRKEDFQKLLLPFVASVGDGHTRIHVEYKNNEKQPAGIPLYFSIIEKSLYVSGVVDENHKNLIGSILLSVEDIPFKALCERVTKLRGTDNEYGALALLEGKNYLWYQSQLADLIPEWMKDNITLELKLLSGETKKMTFNLPIEINKPLIMHDSVIEIPSTKNCEFAHNFLDKNRKVAILKVDGMGGFRENFELAGLENQFLLNGARYFYQRYNKKAPPDDKSELLKGIPSATETFKSLVTDMRNYRTETLVVDLRKNGGGNSTLAQFLIYFIFGEDRLISYFAQKSGYETIKYSNLYFDQVQDGKKGTNTPGIELNDNDYWFEDLYELKNLEDFRTQKATAELAELYKKIPTFYNEYKTGKYSNHHRPKKIIVLCSPETYSSGYTMMKMLNVMGATLIGTPSSQAENAPGWVLNFKLKNSGLTGWVACKFYTSFSNRIKNGVYQLDQELTYNKLKEYDFDPNSEILLALSLIKKESD